MKWIGVLAFFGLLICVEAQYLDRRCTSRGGSCKYTSVPCANGMFVRGLCSGPSNRRCCVPSSPGGGNSGSGYNDEACTDRGGSCMTSCPGGTTVPGMCGGPSNRRCCFRESDPCSNKQKQLACQLLREPNIVAAKSHPSGEVDNAYAYNNLRDMCNGQKASRSSYRCNNKCNAPGGSVCLSLNLLNYLLKLTDTGIVQINELAGACHSCKSRHFSGLAADLHKTQSRKIAYINECTGHHGLPIEEKNHIHCQFYDGPHPFFSN